MDHSSLFFPPPGVWRICRSPVPPRRYLLQLFDPSESDGFGIDRQAGRGTERGERGAREMEMLCLWPVLVEAPFGGKLKPIVGVARCNLAQVGELQWL